MHEIQLLRKTSYSAIQEKSFPLFFLFKVATYSQQRPAAKSSLLQQLY